MHLPWSKTPSPEAVKGATPGMTRSQASLSGPDGDGKEHNLQYWLDSGFLTLPKDPGRTGM
ncbi:hypothetical protein [Jatrophihabitans sp.]|uniref:hypothetical protein n=1 Tax=Jatrophihabitans sp. TaxID=1932789 RepID=UPI0030C6C882|nr:hypothetical protein [Jatrophihabitans sp.]